MALRVDLYKGLVQQTSAVTFDVLNFLTKSTNNFPLDIKESHLRFISELRDAITNELIFANDTPNLSYQLLSLLYFLGSEETVIHMKKIPGGTDPYEWVTRLSPIFKESRDNVFDIREALQSEVEAVKGLYVCPKCRSRNTMSVAKQTTSADEQTNVFVTCLEPGCGIRFKR